MDNTQNLKDDFNKQNHQDAFILHAYLEKIRPDTKEKSRRH